MNCEKEFASTWIFVRVLSVVKFLNRAIIADLLLVSPHAYTDSAPLLCPLPPDPKSTTKRSRPAVFPTVAKTQVFQLLQTIQYITDGRGDEQFRKGMSFFNHV